MNLEPAPATIFSARTVLTHAGPDVEAFATIDGRVVATGDRVSLREQFPSAEQRDLGDVVLMPGFNDAHAHPALLADGGLYVDLAPTRAATAEDVRRLLSERAAATTNSTEWLVGHNFDVSRTADGASIDRDFLDRIAPDRPVLIIHYSYHGAIANTLALKAAGYHDGDPDPVGGELVRDSTGRLSGVLWERAWMEGYLGHGGRASLLPEPSIEARADSLRTVLTAMNAAGITSICDAMVHPDDWRLYQHAAAEGTLTARISMLLWYEFRSAARSLGLRSGLGDEWLRFHGIKMMTDGAVSGGTCLCSKPYRDATGALSHGVQVMPDDEITAVIHDVIQHGSRVAVHANGDSAISKVLDAIATAPGFDPSQRHRIEHCSMADQNLIGRIHELGVIPVPFGAFVGYHGHNLIAHYGTERAAEVAPHRAFLDAGIPVGGSSDYPCGPYEPLLAIQSMVTRRSHQGDVIGEDQRVSVDEALRVYTIGSAYSTGEESVKGRIAPGQLADFVALEADPRTVPTDELSQIAVQSTWVGARSVWQRS